jgi:DNA-binding protein HU-beta
MNAIAAGEGLREKQFGLPNRTAPTKPRTTTDASQPTIIMCPALLIFNAGYYGSSNTAYTGCEKGGPIDIRVLNVGSPGAPYKPQVSSTFRLHQRAIALTGFATMAKALTKSQTVASVAETVGITKKQAGQVIEALVALAYKQAKNSFTIPGLGKIVLVNRKARMGRNPATGETIKIAAKRVVKFRVAKAAKDAILGTK